MPFKFEITDQHGSLEFSGELGCVRVCRVRMLKKIKQAFLLKGLSVQLMMVLMASLDGLLVTAFSLWLGSIVARPTC